jgi:hypothetical protein
MNPVDVSGTVKEVRARDYNGKTYRSVVLCTGTDYRGGDHLVEIEGFAMAGDAIAALNTGDEVTVATVIESRLKRDGLGYFTKAVARKTTVTKRAVPGTSTTTPSAKVDDSNVPF